MTGYPVEIAKFTIGDADVRGIYVSVYLPGYLSMGAPVWCNSSATSINSRQCSIFKQKHAFFCGEGIQIEGFMYSSFRFICGSPGLYGY